MSHSSDMNPSEKDCWITCMSCFRCQDKGKYDRCSSCSGRHDPTVAAGVAQIDGVRVYLQNSRKDPYYIDDRCRCKEGVLQWRTQKGKFIVRRFATSPFEGKVQTDAESSDDRQWNQFVGEQREYLNDPGWDAITFNDGSSVTDWMSNARKGKNG